MNKLTKISAVLLASLTIASAANAATTGAYVGGGLGASTLRTPDAEKYYAYIPGAVKFHNETGGLGGKLFAGYNFTNNFGIEAAYAQYASSEYKATDFVGNTVKHTFDLNAVSVVGKAYLPLSNNKFNVYALGGLALVNASQEVKINGHKLKSESVNHIRPTLGLGASYDINAKLTANVEFSRIFGNGNTKTSLKAIPNADMLSAGLAYNFG